MDEVTVSQDFKRVADFRPDPEEYKALRQLLTGAKIHPIPDEIDVDEIYDVEEG